jgi:hypothetical protein
VYAKLEEKYFVLNVMYLHAVYRLAYNYIPTILGYKDEDKLSLGVQKQESLSVNFNYIPTISGYKEQDKLSMGYKKLRGL